MLDTLERWSLVNSSKSVKREKWPDNAPVQQIQIGQSHPFHLHQNEFIVETINGLDVSIDPSKNQVGDAYIGDSLVDCLLYTSPSPRDRTRSRMPSSA